MAGFDKMDIVKSSTIDYKEYDRSAHGIKEARKGGLQIVVPGPRLLTIDLDDDESEKFLDARLKSLKEYMEPVSRKETVSKQGRKHVYLILNGGMKVLEQIALQACLGSDRKREMLCYKRVLMKDPYPVLMFEKPDTDLSWLIPDLGEILKEN